MKNLALIPAAALLAAFGQAAHAAPAVSSVSLFATGAAVGATGPDSVATGNGSVWVEYGNGANGQAGTGSSTIVQYSAGNGGIQAQYSIGGLVDGLRTNPITGQVWALQNNDGNATLSIINPATQQVSGPLSYAPPYVYGASSGRGYDDVAFANGNVYLSYTNPASPTDPVIQQLDQGNNPTGPLTTTTILTAGQTSTDPNNLPDSDGLTVTPTGDLVQTAEGDGPGSGSIGEYTLVHNPGAANQSVTNVVVTDSSGNNVYSMDDVVYPSATSGTLYVTDAATSSIYAIDVTGLDPNMPLASIGGFNLADGSGVSKIGEIATVDPTTGVATPLVVGSDIPGDPTVFTLGAFVPTAVPEPGSLALLGTGLLAALGLGRRKRT